MELLAVGWLGEWWAGDWVVRWAVGLSAVQRAPKRSVNGELRYGLRLGCQPETLPLALEDRFERSSQVHHRPIGLSEMLIAPGFFDGAQALEHFLVLVQHMEVGAAQT